MLSIRDLAVLVAVVEWDNKEQKYGAQAQPCTVSSLFSASRGGLVNEIIDRYKLKQRKQAVPISQPEQIYRAIRKLVDEGYIYPLREDARQQFVATPEGKTLANKLMQLEPDVWVLKMRDSGHEGFLPLPYQSP
jgi:hypothetical protein